MGTVYQEGPSGALISLHLQSNSHLQLHIRPGCPTLPSEDSISPPIILPSNNRAGQTVRRGNKDCSSQKKSFHTHTHAWGKATRKLLNMTLLVCLNFGVYGLESYSIHQCRYSFMVTSNTMHSCRFDLILGFSRLTSQGISVKLYTSTFDSISVHAVLIHTV